MDPIKEARREYQRQWRIKNKDKRNAYEKKWREAHSEQEKARAKAKGRAYRATPEGRGCRLFQGAKKRARECGLEFSLTKEWVVEKVKSGTCEVTGLPFELTEGRNLFGPSLDKIDPHKGYTPDNVSVVVWCYNAAKGVGHYEDVLKLAKAIVANDNSR